MTEPTVPVSLIEEVRAVLNRQTWPLRWEDVQEARRLLHALLSQPTPSAERWQDRPHEAREDVDDYSMCLCGSPVDATLHDSAPPRIEDMTPGTMFTAETEDGYSSRWTVTTTGVRAHGGVLYNIGYIDSSTIRDVTPPKEQP